MKQRVEFVPTELRPKKYHIETRLAVSKVKREKYRKETIVYFQIKDIKNLEESLFKKINEYQLARQRKNWDLIVPLEIELDLLIEEYAKAKLYITLP